MKKNFSRTLIALLAVVAIVSIGSYAYAEWGYGQRGYGPHHEYGPDYGPRGYGRHGYGMGYGHRGDGMGYGPRGDGMGYGPGRGYEGDLTRDEIEKLDKEREAFYQNTETLRDDIHEKRVELRRELSEENPDAKNAAKLQKEISSLRAEIDQKRIDHMIEMRKIAPRAGRGWRGGYGPGGGGFCGQ